ncbi:peptidoglycan-binding protein [Dyella humi]|uniref:Peptidoglycan-binding protein n=1 Tax=Dyella humi TaxID=1770547 RepID=A0ABW8II92_9GAMM
MPGKEIYGSMIQEKGLAYRDSQILGPERTHYGEPIDNSPGRLAGNSHIWGDASAEVQSRAIDAVMQAAQKGGLDEHQTAYVLAIARAESGFNPDAAAGTTTAFGIGQFVDGTGKGYGITALNRGDITKQAEALVETYKDNAALAKSRGQGEEYIYKYHHDGPAGDWGGIELSKQHVMPYVGKYEEFVQQYEKTHAVLPPEPGFDKRNHADFGKPSHHHAADGTLRQGAHGNAVNALQADLAALGYTDNRGQALQPDGYFGRNTEAAVRAFQSDHSLLSDGIAGASTLQVIHGQRQLLNHTPALSPELEGRAANRTVGVNTLDVVKERENALQSNSAKTSHTSSHTQGITRHSSIHDMFQAMCHAAASKDMDSLCAIGKAYENSPSGQALLAQGAELNRQQVQAQVLAERQTQAQAHQMQQRAGRSM